MTERDGRLRVNDRILEINCQDIKNGSKNDALKLISVKMLKRILIKFRHYHQSMLIRLAHRSGLKKIRKLPKNKKLLKASTHSHPIGKVR